MYIHILQARPWWTDRLYLHPDALQALDMSSETLFSAVNCSVMLNWCIIADALIDSQSHKRSWRVWRVGSGGRISCIQVAVQKRTIHIPRPRRLEMNVFLCPSTRNATARAL